MLWACVRGLSRRQRKEEPTPLLDCIRGRRSVFPKSFVPGSVVPPATVHRLLEAAMWAPFHGPVPPWRFVVLGRKGMVQMQEMTLAFYDEHWREVGWANGKRGSEDEYLAWRRMTEGEITGRWGPVSYMLAIIMRRQAGSKRMPEWEEAAATACAVQNMHIQASASGSHALEFVARGGATQMPCVRSWVWARRIAAWASSSSPGASRISVTNVAAPLAGISVSSGGTDRPCPRPPPLCRVAVMQYSPDKPRDLCGCTLMHHRPLDAVSDVTLFACVALTPFTKVRARCIFSASARPPCFRGGAERRSRRKQHDCSPPTDPHPTCTFLLRFLPRN